MTRAVLAWALVLLAGTATAAAGQHAEARRFYNQELYELAIRAASEARQSGQSADEAAVIIARAHLERFRQTRDALHLTAARDALRGVNAGALPSSVQTEFTLALGQFLFLDDRFRAAAEVFDGVVARVDALGPPARDRALDWWATAMDQQAQLDPAHRQALYQRIIDRMEAELRLAPGSAAAGYWLPAAARSAGDTEHAWHAALAGYLRARLAQDGGAALRADLDRLVTTAIIPERAREQAGPSGDVRAQADAMAMEWERFKNSWQ
jgi:hypothetical protein